MTSPAPAPRGAPEERPGPPARPRRAGAPWRPAAGAHLRRRRRLFWPFVLPALALYVAFLVLPTLAAIAASFSRWHGAGDAPRFDGLHQYHALLHDPAFWYSFQNTLIYVLVGGVGTFVLAFAFTMTLRDMRGGNLVRAILFFPNIVAPIALGVFLGFMFKFDPTDQGLANVLLQHLGLAPRKFLQPEHVSWLVAGALIWAGVGFYLTILMAAVSRIPGYLYEDARLAGASPWQQFRSITFPLTWDVTSIAGVLWTINAVKIFELVFVLAGPGTYSPPIHAWTLGIYVYDRSFGSSGSPQFGTVCACGVVMIALVTFFVLLLRRLMRREVIQF